MNKTKTEIKIEAEKKLLKNRLCTICGKPDKFSDKCVCGNCIQRWKLILTKKAKLQMCREMREKFVKLIDECRIMHYEFDGKETTNELVSKKELKSKLKEI